MVALSGGVDSTLAAYLAVEALESGRVRGLVTTGAVSRSANTSDAEAVARDRQIDDDVADIAGTLETLLGEYPDAGGDDGAVGNARVRIRAVLNCLVANHENRLVLGAGNRTERAATDARPTLLTRTRSPASPGRLSNRTSVLTSHFTPVIHPSIRPTPRYLVPYRTLPPTIVYSLSSSPTSS